MDGLFSWVPRDHCASLWTPVLETYLSVEPFGCDCPAGCEFQVTARDACDRETRSLHGCLIKDYSRLTHLPPTTGCEEAGDGPVILEII